MRRTARLICLLFVGLLCACGGTQQDPDSPEAILNAFYDHLNSGGESAAKALYTEKTRQMFDDPEMASDNAFGDWVASETKQSSISEVNILNQTVEAESAEISFEIRYDDGSRAVRDVTMLLENGAWKLDLIRVGS